MLSRSVLSFLTCCSSRLLQDICVMVSSLEHYKTSTVGYRSFYFSVLFRNFPFFVSALLLLCVFLSSILELLVFFFSYVFCLIRSIIFFISRVFSFIILSRNFLSMIAVMFFDISSSSAEIVVKLHSFSISINRLQNSSGVSSSVCFAQKNILDCGKCFFSACRTR